MIVQAQAIACLSCQGLLLKAIDTSSATAPVAQDLLKTLEILSETTVR